ncbi:MAG: hypothetical protein VKK04_22225 [Synechococcales bacterium]|nr:hypothetical protein [Synechococcales bacterium]
MKKFLSIMATATLLTLATSFDQALTSPHVVETNRDFNWVVVPQALGNPEPGNPNAAPEPWYIDVNSLMLQGNAVVFEAVSPDARYTLFHGDCQCNYIKATHEGEFLDNTSISYYPLFDQWQPATDWRLALLTFACTQ